MNGNSGDVNVQKPRNRMAAKPKDDLLDFLDEQFEPFDVVCARCGRSGPCDEFMVEEADEWECRPCWERCEAQERAKQGK